MRFLADSLASAIHAYCVFLRVGIFGAVSFLTLSDIAQLAWHGGIQQHLPLLSRVFMSVP